MGVFVLLINVKSAPLSHKTSQYWFTLVYMWTNRRLIFIFYQPLFIANLVFSLIALRFLAINGWGTVLVSIIIKAVGYAAVVGYQYYFSQKVFFYYRNAGVPIRKLYGYAFSLDLLMYCLMMLVYCLAS